MSKVSNWNNYIEYLKDWADQHREIEKRRNVASMLWRIFI